MDCTTTCVGNLATWLACGLAEQERTIKQRAAENATLAAEGTLQLIRIVDYTVLYRERDV